MRWVQVKGRGLMETYLLHCLPADSPNAPEPDAWGNSAPLVAPLPLSAVQATRASGAAMSAISMRR